LISPLVNPDPIPVIKLLLPLRKLTKEPLVDATIFQMMGIAFSQSVCFSTALEEFIAAIEEGRDPDEELRERFQKQQAEAGQVTNAADEGAEKEREQ
jgi:Tfp pilus assembly protein PilO